MADTSKPDSWSARSCKPCQGGVAPMDEAEVRSRLPSLDGWDLAEGELRKTYSFKGFYRTLAFVNAVAWVSQQENHHPTFVVGYKTCELRYVTHEIGGISENDFICAAKADALLG